MSIKAGWAGRGKARPGEAGQGRQGEARRGLARRGEARQDKAGKARRGTAGRGSARQATATPGRPSSRSNRRQINGANEMTTAKTAVAVQIKPPKIETAVFNIKGTAPFVQARFSAKAMQAMKAKMLEGSTAKGKKVREARDFEDDFRQAMHVSTDGWVGIPASAFRQAIISACRLVGFRMTLAKLSVFVEADGFDKVDGIPLIRLDAGDPEMLEMAVRNQTGVADIRVRPMWREWGAAVKVRYDADQFTISDVTNLMARVGMQVGIGEGRPDSRESAGLGWGTFEIQ